MYGMERSLKDWNYNICTDKIRMDKTLSLKYIEKNLSASGKKLLKWAITNVEDDKIVVQATFLNMRD